MDFTPENDPTTARTDASSATTTAPTASGVAVSGTGFAGRIRPLLRRADAYTLWAFNAPAHLGGRDQRVTR